MANAVVQALDDWHLADKVKAMSFDTTTSNSGALAGAAVLIERKMAKNLLHLACRHHIFEVMLGDVFKSLAGPSSGPDIQVFKRFKNAWPSINHDNDRIVDGKADEETAAFFCSNQELVNEVVEFAKKFLQEENQPRDDYKELLELALIYMGHVPPRGIHLTAPGAMHRARWMAKAIYSLKVFCFRSQFHLTRRESDLLRIMNLFICFVYLKSWFTAPFSIHAPLNDLQCFERLGNFQTVNSDVATKALLRHTWYLSEELIAFSFFDERIDATTKARMVEAMKTKQGLQIPLKRPQVTGRTMPLRIEDFVTTNTDRFFTILEIPYGWLEKEPCLWTEDSDYLASQKIASGLSVVNDRAERGVALIQDYNQILTKHEGQK
jgi:hypothetical protein